LPSEFTGERIGVRFHYFYNVQPEVSFTITPSFDVRVPVGSALQFSVSGEEAGAGPVRWSVSGLGARNRLAAKSQSPASIPAPSRIPDPPTVIVQRYREVIQTRLKSLSCRQPRCTNLRFAADGRGIPPLRKERAKMGHPRVGVCPEKIKSKIKTKTKNQDQEQRQRTGVSALQGRTRPAPLPLLGRCTGLRFAAGGRGILPLRKNAQRWGTRGQGSSEENQNQNQK